MLTRGGVRERERERANVLHCCELPHRFGYARELESESLSRFEELGRRSAQSLGQGDCITQQYQTEGTGE